MQATNRWPETGFRTDQRLYSEHTQQIAMLFLNHCALLLMDTPQTLRKLKLAFETINEPTNVTKYLTKFSCFSVRILVVISRRSAENLETANLGCIKQTNFFPCRTGRRRPPGAPLLVEVARFGARRLAQAVQEAEHPSLPLARPTRSHSARQSVARRQRAAGNGCPASRALLAQMRRALRLQ